MHIDLLLNLTVDCEKEVNNRNTILGLIRRSYSYLDETSLGKSLVRPHLEYANNVSAPVNKNDSVAGKHAEKRNPYGA